MRVVSVNCGLPREVGWRGHTFTTSIWKEPVEGRVALRTLNLDGDRQSDLSVHGGKDKAVYCYPLEHYDYWRAELPGRELPIAIFGENFTIQDSPLENEVRVGDRFSVGTAEVVVTQPRLPCYKLGIRFDLEEMVKRFLKAGRTGFYLAVSREGEVGAGDEIRMLGRAAESVSISEITRLYIAKRFDGPDVLQVQRALSADALPESWKQYFREKLARQG
jgi:MOSC domain-containing protein YiiM